MSKFIDLTGHKFNRLTVIERMPNAPKGKTVWKCQCDCGNITIVRGSNLKTGQVKSCGCAQKGWNCIHGDSNTPLYNHWYSMINRCENPNNHAFKDYGGRGIKVCEEWHDYITFKKWVMETKPISKQELTVDRIDVNGNYSPDNCRWTSRKIQARNRTSNILIEFEGKKQSLIEWCEELHLDYKRIHNRISKLHWTFEKAISTPVNENKRNKEARKKWQNTSETSHN